MLHSLIFCCLTIFSIALEEIKLKIINFSGFNINVYWLSNDNSLISQSDTYIRNGTKFYISSFQSHRFVILRRGETYVERKSAVLMIGKYDLTCLVWLHADNLKLDLSTEISRDRDKLIKKVEACRLNDINIIDCVTHGLYNQLELKENEKMNLLNYRNSMTESIYKYMCSNNYTDIYNSESSSLIDLNIDNQKMRYDLIHNSSGAKIWIVYNGINEIECNELIESAQFRLTKATEYGTNSNLRKASAFTLLDDDFNENIYSFYTRLNHLVKYLTNYDLKLIGQEGLSVIRYRENEEYNLHCDGPCGDFNQKGVRIGARIATAINYCKSPIKGGELLFPNINIKIPVTPGMIVVFSYADGAIEQDDSSNREQDPNSFTKHAGCPVQEGEKWIATSWYRYFSDIHEAKWSDYDAHGIPI